MNLSAISVAFCIETLKALTFKKRKTSCGYHLAKKTSSVSTAVIVTADGFGVRRSARSNFRRLAQGYDPDGRQLSTAKHFSKTGAHHLDFRAALPDDLPSVIAARKTEKAYIAKWVAQRRDQSQTGLFFGPRLAIFLAGSAALLFGAVGVVLGALGAREYVLRELSSRTGYRSLSNV